MRPGDTYIRAGNHIKTDPHLWIVISDPSKNTSLVTVNVTSQGIDKDQACVLNAGEHRFIEHESVIMYAGARLPLESMILEAIRNGMLRKHDQVSNAILGRIQAGAAKSDKLPLGAKRILQAQGIIPHDG